MDSKGPSSHLFPVMFTLRHIQQGEGLVERVLEIQYTRAVCMFYVVIIQFTRITQSNPTFPHSPHPRVTRSKGLQPRLALAPPICPDQAGESCSNLDVKYEEGYTVDGRQGDCLLLSCTHRHVCRSVFQSNAKN